MTAQPMNEKVEQDLRALIEDAEELLKATAGHGGEQVQKLRQRLNEVLQSARVTCQRLQEKTLETAKAADRTIRAHPYESLGVAFGVGVLIGVLVGRR